MTGNIVARRYARALFAIGKEKGAAELDAYGKDLAGLAQALENAPELLRVFRNPIINVEEKKAVLNKLMADASAVVRNFCLLLADKGRLGILPDIEADFRALLDAEKGIVRGQLVTAMDLDQAKQDDVKKQLESQVEGSLVLDFNVDPSILGGVVLKVGDKVLDGSLRAQLGILKENIKRGE